jgi:hypothetical protein
MQHPSYIARACSDADNPSIKNTIKQNYLNNWLEIKNLVKEKNGNR